MDTDANGSSLSHDDPLTEAADTLASLIEHYERQKNWIQYAQQSVQRVQQQRQTRSPPARSPASNSSSASPTPSTSTPPSASRPRPIQLPPPVPQLTAQDPRQRMLQPPVLNVAGLLQLYGSIVSERVESCKRTAELIREADRLSLEKFESTHTFDFDRPH